MARRWGGALVRAAYRADAGWRRPDAVMLGDSITREWLAGDPSFFVGRRRMMAGVNGDTTAGMRARFDADVAGRAPRVVHIMGGTNDLWHGAPGLEAGDTIANVAAMIRAARAAGIVPLVAPPPPIAAVAATLFAHDHLRPVLRERLRDLCEGTGTAHVDYAASLAGADGAIRPALTTDGVHLNRAGYRAMRAQAEAAIAGAR